METAIIVVVVLAVLGVLTVFLARRLGGPEATARTLLATYHAFEAKGAAEDERLFQMFDTRMGWRQLPKPFLRELSRRLAAKEAVVKFMTLSERYQLLGSNFRAIALKVEAGDDEVITFAVDQVAMTLTSLGNHLGGQGVAAQAERLHSRARS